MISTISFLEMVSSGSMKLLTSGRLTMICWTVKSLSVTVKSMTRPSLVPFLVSTLRPGSLKLSARIFWILMTSSVETNPSILSTTAPRLEYSRMLAVSRMLDDLEMRGPAATKAIILRLLGSTIGSAR